MNIKFILPHEMPMQRIDEIIDNVDSLLQPPLVIKGLKSIKEKIETRFAIIKDEIEKEEENSIECIILMDLRTSSLGLNYFGYSDELTNKMEQSITNNDFTMIIRELLG